MLLENLTSDAAKVMLLGSTATDIQTGSIAGQSSTLTSTMKLVSQAQESTDVMLVKGDEVAAVAFSAGEASVPLTTHEVSRSSCTTATLSRSPPQDDSQPTGTMN